MKLSRIIFIFVTLIFFCISAAIINTACDPEVIIMAPPTSITTPDTVDIPCEYSGCMDQTCYYEECSQIELTGGDTICESAGISASGFCYVGQKLFDYCIFQKTCLTEEEYGELMEGLNDLWTDICFQMTNSEFNEEYLNASFTTFINDNEQALTKLFTGLLYEANLCDDSSSDSAMDSMVSLIGYLQDFSTCSGDFWDTIESYSGLLGLYPEDACTILEENISALNDMLNLFSDSDEDATILNAISGDVCGFDSDILDPCDTSVSHLLYTLSDSDSYSCSEIKPVVCGIVTNELPDIIAQVVSLFADIHDTSEDLSAIAGLLPTLPSLLAGIVSSDMNSCE